MKFTALSQTTDPLVVSSQASTAHKALSLNCLAMPSQITSRHMHSSAAVTVVFMCLLMSSLTAAAPIPEANPQPAEVSCTTVVVAAAADLLRCLLSSL